MRQLLFLQRGVATCGALAAWFAMCGTAMAQARPGMPPPPPPSSNSYVVSYMLVLLGVGLGMLVLCRSSRRRDRAGAEQYQEDKFGIGEQ